MTQPSLFPPEVADTLTCPVCGYTGRLDDFEGAGFGDGIVLCEKGRLKKSPIDGRGRRGFVFKCWALIEVATGKEYTGPVDDDC